MTDNDQVPEGQAEEPTIKEFIPNDPKNLAEAGGSANITIFGALNGSVLQLTGRGHTTKEAIENLFNGLAHALNIRYGDAGELPPEAEKWEGRFQMERPKTSAPPVVPSPSPEQEAVVVSAPPPPPPVGTTSVSPPPPPVDTVNVAVGQSNKPINIMDVQKMVVEPQQGGKVKLGFKRSSDQWNRISTTRQPDSLVTMLDETGQGWTIDHLRAPAEYDVAIRVHWVESDNVNTAGNPYKDIVKLTSL